MRIVAISKEECIETLERVSIGRLGCSLGDQPYVVPVAFSYESDSIYIFSTVGKKINWMRQNPKVCLQVDEIGNRRNWLSVIVTGAGTCARTARAVFSLLANGFSRKARTNWRSVDRAGFLPHRH